MAITKTQLKSMIVSKRKVIKSLNEESENHKGIKSYNNREVVRLNIEIDFINDTLLNIYY